MSSLQTGILYPSKVKNKTLFIGVDLSVLNPDCIPKKNNIYLYDRVFGLGEGDFLSVCDTLWFWMVQNGDFLSNNDDDSDEDDDDDHDNSKDHKDQYDKENTICRQVHLRLYFCGIEIIIRKLQEFVCFTICRIKMLS